MIGRSALIAKEMGGLPAHLLNLGRPADVRLPSRDLLCNRKIRYNENTM